MAPSSLAVAIIEPFAEMEVVRTRRDTGHYRGDVTTLRCCRARKDSACLAMVQKRRMPRHFFRPNDPQSRQIGAAQNTPLIERSRYTTVRSRSNELDAGSVEFATSLETTRLLNTRGLPRHVLEHATKVLHGF